MANNLINNTKKIDFNILELRIDRALIAVDKDTQAFNPFTPNYFNLSLEQLLNLRDKKFIKACFCTILGREADQESLKHYLKKLEKGYDQRSIIAFLRYSKEGKIRFKNNNHNLPSLSKYRLLCVPIIGEMLIKLLPLYKKMHQI